MGEPIKKDFENPMNKKIQQKFDLIFKQSNGKHSDSNDTKSSVLGAEPDDNFEFDLAPSEDVHMATKKEMTTSAPTLDINFGDDEGGIEFENNASPPSPVVSGKAEGAATLAIVPDDNDLGFSLDFGDDLLDLTPATSTQDPASAKGMLDIPSLDTSEFGFELDGINGAENIDIPEDESTKKTIIFSSKKVSETEESDLDSTDSFDISAMQDTEEMEVSSDFMSTEEAKANIETTIKDIIRPKDLGQEVIPRNKQIEKTEEFIDFSMNAEEFMDDTPAEDVIDFGSHGPLKKILNDEAEDSFDFSEAELADKEPPEEIMKEKTRVIRQVEESFQSIPKIPDSFTANSGHGGDEEAVRTHATVRQLREEREDLLIQIKTLKGTSRELEQDNLTLKSALDESRIEVSILRKRHMVEVEDIKYRLSVNEEKKEQALEKARQSDGKREKLEQRVRIDFNQVKQREKELETRLEMLTIDVDSQVQTRDQKILELRRKIDSLEFNMENVSIKEHKSQDDKRKLEDKLNKIMKTLRHSIKNLEDDIEQASDESMDEKLNPRQRLGKA